MTRELLNTLFVTTTGAYVHADHETLRVEVEGRTILQVPALHLGSVVLLGRVGLSAEVIRRCAAEGRGIVFMDDAGRFQARVYGPTSGNVLLRKAQYDAHSDPRRRAGIARAIVAAKLRNSRVVLLRAARESRNPEAASRLRTAGEGIAALFGALAAERERYPLEDRDLDVLRGLEGQAAALYFEAFGDMLTVPTEEFAFRLRTRRPPRDRTNAILSFLYSLLTQDCVGALEGVGLDPQMGYLHTLRPGRPALALDLVEEFRGGLADRLALTLINRRQLRPEHFEAREGGSTRMEGEGRKLLLSAYQKRKQEEVSHPLLKDPVPLGLIPHLQARLLARHLRGELADYPPYLFR